MFSDESLEKRRLPYLNFGVLGASYLNIEE